MKIAYSKTREQFPLSPRKILKKTVQTTARYGFALLACGVVIMTVFSPLGSSGLAPLGKTMTQFFLLLLGVFGLTVLVAYFYQCWYFAVYFYDLTADFVQIRKGPIMPHEITTPYERIQDVYVEQDFLDRLFGLYDVHLSSATASSVMEAHIDGVEREAAEGLRELLLQKVRERVSNRSQAV